MLCNDKYKMNFDKKHLFRLFKYSTVFINKNLRTILILLTDEYKKK